MLFEDLGEDVLLLIASEFIGYEPLYNGDGRHAITYDLINLSTVSKSIRRLLLPLLFQHLHLGIFLGPEDTGTTRKIMKGH